MKIVGFALVILGFLIAELGVWHPEAEFWFGPLEEDSDSERRRKTRLKIVGVALVISGILVLKFGVNWD